MPSVKFSALVLSFCGIHVGTFSVCGGSIVSCTDSNLNRRKGLVYRSEQDISIVLFPYIAKGGAITMLHGLVYKLILAMLKNVTEQSMSINVNVDHKSLH